MFGATIHNRRRQTRKSELLALLKKVCLVPFLPAKSLYVLSPKSHKQFFKTLPQRYKNNFNMR